MTLLLIGKYVRYSEGPQLFEVSHYTKSHLNKRHTFSKIYFHTSRSRKLRLTTMGIRCADHATPLSGKVGTTSPTSGGRSFGIVR
jgi:hypothetical protein